MTFSLTPELNQQDRIQLLARFHFEQEELPLINSLYQVLLPLVEARAYCCLPFQALSTGSQTTAGLIVTLGSGVDELYDLYLNRGLLKEAYIIDCLGLELLSKCYESAVHTIEGKSSLYVERLSFLGDDYPLSLLPALLLECDAKEVRANDAFFMKPTKSVGLLLPLSENKKADVTSLCNTCDSCKNISCPSRKRAKPKLPLTYGNLQFFLNR